MCDKNLLECGYNESIIQVMKAKISLFVFLYIIFIRYDVVKLYHTSNSDVFLNISA